MWWWWCVAASAQTPPAVTTPISINLAGSGTGNAKDGVNLTAGGTLEPYGNVTVTITSTPAGSSTVIPVTFIFTLPAGDTLQATSPAAGRTEQILGAATITAGTGKFQGAHGSFGFSLVAPPGTTGANVHFTLTGNGWVILPGTPSDELIVSQNQIDFFGTAQQSIPFLAYAGAKSAKSVTVSATAAAPAPPWLAILNALQTIPSPSTAAMTMVVNPAGLLPGVYAGNVTVTAGPSGSSANPLKQTVQITLIVPAAGTQVVPRLVLSQTGMQFTSAGATPPVQQIDVSASQVSTGSSLIPFTAMVTPLTGGNWLTITPSSGTASATSPTQVSVQANPAQLAKGTYFGRVDFSDGFVTTQDSIVVAFNVTDNSGNPAFIDPLGLIFPVAAGSTSAAQSILISNLATDSLSYSVNTAYQQGSGWISVTPASGAIGAGKEQSLAVTVNAAGLAPGIYNGVVSFTVTSGSQAIGWGYPVEVLMVVLPAAQAATSSFTGAASAACTPTKLLAVFTRLGDNFHTTAAFPVSLAASVLDDCGYPLTAGLVSASFSNGDPPAIMTSIGNGRWEGTWMPHGAAGGPASVTLLAANATITGSARISGTVAANTTTPLVVSGGTVSAASYAPGQPLAPGGFLSIFGTNLASGPAYASSLPLPANLLGTRVTLGGESLALNYVSPKQINAVAPYDLPDGTVLQLIVEQNGALSMPEPVVLSAAEPAAFTRDQSGGGAGVIVVVKPDGKQFPNTASAPASVGDALVVYCTGLGPVTPAVEAGAAAPASPLSHTADPVTVSIGGRSAPVLFSGLTPGFAGLYQVNVSVPPGVAAGSSVPLVLSVAGVAGPPVTVAIQ